MAEYLGERKRVHEPTSTVRQPSRRADAQTQPANLELEHAPTPAPARPSLRHPPACSFRSLPSPATPFSEPAAAHLGWERSSQVQSSRLGVLTDGDRCADKLGRAVGRPSRSRRRCRAALGSSAWPAQLELGLGRFTLRAWLCRLRKAQPVASPRTLSFKLFFATPTSLSRASTRAGLAQPTQLRRARFSVSGHNLRAMSTSHRRQATKSKSGTGQTLSLKGSTKQVFEFFEYSVNS